MSGEIPAWLGNEHPHITAITIANNNFEGKLPNRKGRDLGKAGTFYFTLEVAGNKLSGELPESFLKFLNSAEDTSAENTELRRRILPQQQGYGFSNYR